MMKRFFYLILLALMSMVANADDYVTINDFRYSLFAEEAEILSCSETLSGDVLIPASITYDGKTYAVTSIGNSAFAYRKKLKSVTIPNSVTSIGDYAFSSCSSLKSVTIPNSVTSIGGYAFEQCSKLESVTIPNSVTSIVSSVFQYCSKLESVTIPNSVTSIGSSAFYDCYSLKSVTIPNSVTSIGSSAFSNCIRLIDIYVASPEPADCEGIKTFESNDNSMVRDKYDIYNYAVLHVPMGSKEKYAAAYEWRYFSKIKEDMEINGKVFYTTLSVNQAGEGYVKHYVKADEPYTIFIGSDEGLRINTVMFNGDDVTDKLVEGYYTTPNIKQPSKISISFEQTIDNVKGVAMEDDLHVYGNDGSLFISGITNPQKLSVYSLNGTLIETQELDGDAKIKLNEGVFIVNVGNRSFKVSM